MNNRGLDRALGLFLGRETCEYFVISNYHHLQRDHHHSTQNKAEPTIQLFKIQHGCFFLLGVHGGSQRDDQVHLIVWAILVVPVVVVMLVAIILLLVDFYTFYQNTCNQAKNRQTIERGGGWDC